MWRMGLVVTLLMGAASCPRSPHLTTPVCSQLYPQHAIPACRLYV